MDFRTLLNTRKWHTGDLGALTLVIRHRGAPGDERRVSGSEILEITSGGVFVRVTDESGAPIDDGRAWIPYHRILRISAPDALLYERPGSARDPSEPPEPEAA